MKKSLYISLKITVAFCIIFFVGYVLVLWGFAAIMKPNHGQAELVECNEKVVGAANVGQSFTDAKYFWGRPSAVDYNGGSSGGSNKGPSNPEYLSEVSARIDTFLVAHPYLSHTEVPSEMVTASGSGLDPHISPQGAQVQIPRIAEARGMTMEAVKKIVDEHTKNPLLGKPYINLLKLNIALDYAANH